MLMVSMPIDFNGMTKPISMWKKISLFKYLFRLGFLDVEEFALAMHLINVKLDGNELPNSLPEHLIPPSQRLNGVE